MTSGPCQETSCTAITLNPESNFTRPREESFPIPLKYIDVSRTTQTNLDVLQESRIDDSWSIDGSRDLSDPWTGFTQFTLLEEKPPDGYMWSGERLTRKTAYIQARSFMARALEVNGKARQAEGKAEVLMKSSILKTLENCEGSVSSTPRIRNSKKPSRTRVRSLKHQWLLLCLVKL